MRRLLTFLVISILILSGLGGVSSSSITKTNTYSTGMQAELQAEAKCGLGVRVKIKNVGTETFEGNIRCNIYINGLIYGKSRYFNHSGIVLPPGKVIWHIMFKIGFGPVTVRLEIDWGQGFLSGNTTGFLIVYFISGADPITIP